MRRCCKSNSHINEYIEGLLNVPIRLSGAGAELGAGPELGARVSERKSISLTNNNGNMRILGFDEYSVLLSSDCKIPFLKENLKRWGLSRVGNKSVLLTRLYNYLFLSNMAVRVQAFFRGFIIKEYIRLHGFKARESCVNERDITTMEEISKIPLHQLYIIRQQEGERERDIKYYGFDMISIFNLFIESAKIPDNKTYIYDKDMCYTIGRRVDNPYTKTVLPDNEFSKILKVLRYGEILGFRIDTYFDDLKPHDYVDNINLRVITLFNEINNLGNYANIQWFYSLDSIRLIDFITELRDIWIYRANLSDRVKYEICPPYGNPFMGILLTALPIMEYPLIRSICVKIMEEMIYKCINDSSKSLGAYYVLACLTLVNRDAADAMPWLYQSVAHD